MRFESEEFLNAPEHEINADEFVEEVLDEIAPNYPNFVFDAINLSKFLSNIDLFSAKDNYSSEEYRNLIILQQELETHTPDYYMTIVDINGNSYHALEEMASLVKLSAIKHNGKLSQNGSVVGLNLEGGPKYKYLLYHEFDTSK